jgi:pyrrolysine biosynthesis protein PylC
MRLAVVGGKLQGNEACYLGEKAGYEVVLVDRREGVPASGLAAETHVFDVLQEPARARDLFAGCDAVLPACEEDDTLAWLDGSCRAWDVPLLFDWPSYQVSSSKIRSNELFDRLGIDRPQPWPSCGFPLIVKPSGSSGSDGVRLVEDEEQLAAARDELERAGHETVIEEFAAGPSLSLEVVAWRGTVATLLATELEFDRYYDCKRVLAPVELEDAGELQVRFAEIGRRLASGLGLNGLMDIEVMVHGDRLKVLEIDARLPSQTPTAVWGACGVNMVQLLAETVLNDALRPVIVSPRRGCCYQHVCVQGGAVEVLGEHMMGGARPLRLVPDLYGADEVITDRPVGACEEDEEWVATLITVAPSAAQARDKAGRAVRRLAEEHGLTVTPETGAQPGDDCR